MVWHRFLRSLLLFMMTQANDLEIVNPYICDKSVLYVPVQVNGYNTIGTESVRAGRSKWLLPYVFCITMDKSYHYYYESLRKFLMV